MGTDSRVRIAMVFPEVLGTYGDGGNAAALVHRTRVRGIECDVINVGLDEAVPAEADIYLLGGGEDAAMMVAWEQLHTTKVLADAVGRGAACLGVCAGLQLLGHHFTGPDGRRHDGLGLLDVTSERLNGPRAVGEVLAEAPAGSSLGFLTGFENHRGDARLGPAAHALGHAVRGTGNGIDGLEGAVQGKIIGTYLHGPVLPRNPALADQLLGWVVGSLPAYEHAAVAELREERRVAALGRRRPWSRPAARLDSRW